MVIKTVFLIGVIGGLSLHMVFHKSFPPIPSLIFVAGVGVVVLVAGVGVIVLLCYV